MAAIEERRSRFLAHAIPVQGRDDVVAAVAAFRHEHAGAAHVVHAFRAGPPNAIIEGASDDGEPSGTAGRPILSAIAGRELTFVAVIVIRYFGGTKLGTGGLVRAYTAAATAALDAAPCRTLELRREVEISCRYDEHHATRDVLTRCDARIISEAFAESISMTIVIREEELVTLQRLVGEIGRGGVVVAPRGAPRFS